MFALVGVRSYGHSCVVVVGCIVCVVLGVVGLCFFLATAKRMATVPVRVVAIERRDEDVAAYAATYLLPFVTVFDGDWQDVLSLVGFILVLGVVYVRSRLIYINPLLSVVGYQLYRVNTVAVSADDGSADRWPRFLLAGRRVRLNPGDEMDVHEPTPDLYLYKGLRERG